MNAGVISAYLALKQRLDLSHEPAAMSLTLKSQRFRAEREADWLRLEGLLKQLEAGRRAQLSDEDVIALPVLYRATLSSLSVARAISLDHSLIAYLESLCTRAYFFVYGSRATLGERVWASSAATGPPRCAPVARDPGVGRAMRPGHTDGLSADDARSGLVLRLRAARPGGRAHAARRRRRSVENPVFQP